MASRRVVNAIDQYKETSQSIFDQYAETKVQFDTIKKKESELKDLVKKTLLEYGLDGHNTDKYKLTLTKTDNTSINMEKLIISLMEEYGKSKLLSLGVFEEKIYVNEERLQELIYEKEIDGTLFTDCLEHKAPTYTLRYKEVK